MDAVDRSSLEVGQFRANIANLLAISANLGKYDPSHGHKHRRAQELARARELRERKRKESMDLFNILGMSKPQDVKDAEMRPLGRWRR